MYWSDLGFAWDHFYKVEVVWWYVMGRVSLVSDIGWECACGVVLGMSPGRRCHLVVWRVFWEWWGAETLAYFLQIKVRVVFQLIRPNGLLYWPGKLYVIFESGNKTAICLVIPLHPPCSPIFDKKGSSSQKRLGNRAVEKKISVLPSILLNIYGWTTFKFLCKGRLEAKINLTISDCHM